MKIQYQLLALCGFSLFQSQVLSAYDLHEWGTFTTVSGSDGRLLTGLHVEEEHLPSFVYSHLGMEPRAQGQYGYLNLQLMNKGAQNKHQISVFQDKKKIIHPMIMFKGIPVAQLKNVTVKMETPVIYFYGDDTPKVNVKVGFNGGTISQWYPDRKSGDTPNKFLKGKNKLSDQLQKMIGDREMVSLSQPIDFSKLYQGAIEWDVEILPKSAADPAFTFKPDENNTWIYPRVPEANMIKVGDEFEDFLFYRGIGNFELPATFSVDSSETLNVTNNSKEAIPFAFAFENIAGKFRYKTIGKIATGEVAKVTEKEWVTPSKTQAQQVEVFQQMRKGLIAQGLTTDEANGMIKTWWKSYFNKPGLRVFWVVTQTDLERILPLAVDPAPANQIRVLVGRADIMRPKFEQQMIADLGTHQFSKYQQDRFILPYMNRLAQLVKKPVYQRFDAVNIASASLMISAKKGTSQQGEGLYLSTGNDVKLQHLQLSGAWEITGKNQLKIGETVFLLDPTKGILTAKATDDPAYDTYEIQLPRVLN
jgi:hypothetical protein